MGVITAETTVADLVPAFGFSSIAQLEAHLNKFGKKSSSGTDPEVQTYMDRIANEVILKRRSEVMKYRTGNLVGQLDGLFSGSGCEETERERRRVHGIVSKALKGLVELAFLDKRCNGSNAAHTYYVWTGAEYVTPEKSEEQETETQVPETVDSVETEEVKTESVEDSKPKARVRRKNKA